MHCRHVLYSILYISFYPYQVLHYIIYYPSLMLFSYLYTISISIFYHIPPIFLHYNSRLAIFQKVFGSEVSKKDPDMKGLQRTRYTGPEWP